MVRARRSRLRRAARSVGRTVAFFAASAAALRAQSGPAEWTIDSGKSRLVIDVAPGGVLASALHAHHFQPETWSGEIARQLERKGGVRVAVRIAADSLRDHQPKLSAKDVAKVEAQVRGAEILDAARYPAITFEAAELRNGELPSGETGEFRGTLAGTLTLHGTTRPLELSVHGQVTADGLQASATGKLRQTDFGIKPYSTALGTISVKDEVSIEITVVATPRARAASSGAPPRD